jgi:spermidine synthase
MVSCKVLVSRCHDAFGGSCRVLVARCRRAFRNGGARTAARSRLFAAVALFVLGPTGCFADSLFDPGVRADMLKHRDGRVAHIESEYNDIFVGKRGPYLAMSTRYKANRYLESVVNLADPDELTGEYTQVMPAGLLYPETTKRILMIGLGAGTISTYLGRALPDVQIDVVELDPGVIGAAKKYFGLQETDRVHIIESDGRVYLNRHKDSYDLILLDAYRELGVPFHLLTREFYALVKEHLTPGGAVALNIDGGTKLYASTIVTLRAVFPTVDVYPVFQARGETQAVPVATSMPEPSTDILMQHATALQGEHQFRYPLPNLVAGRQIDLNVPGGELLTDDFAPVGLYETTPIRPRQRE